MSACRPQRVNRLEEIARFAAGLAVKPRDVSGELYAADVGWLLCEVERLQDLLEYAALRAAREESGPCRSPSAPK